MVVHVAHLVLSNWQPTAYCNHIGGGAGCVGGARALARRFAHARSRQPFLPYIPLASMSDASGSRSGSEKISSLSPVDSADEGTASSSAMLSAARSLPAKNCGRYFREKY